MPLEDPHPVQLALQVTSLCASINSNLILGYQCPGVTGTNLKGLPVKCLPGTYANAQRTLCIDCAAGSYCPNGVV